MSLRCLDQRVEIGRRFDKRIVRAPNETFAGGFATGSGYEIPCTIYRDRLSDFVLLTEDEIHQGIALAAYYTHNLAEGAGAASIAAAWKIREKLAGKKVALQMSGCNASQQELLKAYSHAAFSSGVPV